MSNACVIAKSMKCRPPLDSIRLYNGVCCIGQCLHTIVFPPVLCRGGGGGGPATCDGYYYYNELEAKAILAAYDCPVPRLRSELAVFDLGFFEEVEDLKYSYATLKQEATKLANKQVCGCTVDL